jgi:4-methylaminobutanoate oxidase (formaldehyde-forming)
VADTDWSSAAFPFATVQPVRIAGVDLIAQRVTYVGELGWELHVPVSGATAVFDALVDAGNPFGLKLAGTMAMNSLRLEKSYVSWGHDVSRDDTPLEAGLGFAIAWDKPGGFLGRDALLAQKAAGITRRLVAFTLKDSQPLLWGHEPIWRAGKQVGFTLSASYGHTLGGAVALGYVSNPDGQFSREWATSGDYSIELAGLRHPATVHWQAPYDPARTRILA